jgi:hypothetical protein
LKSVLLDLKSHQNCGKAFRQLLESDWLRSLHNRRSKLHQQAGLEKTRVFFTKTQPSGFFFVFFVFFLYICPEEIVFRVFSVSRIL